MDANNPTIDDFEPEIREMAATSTQQQLLQWLQQQGVIVSLRTLNRRLVQWQISRQTRVFATDETASDLLAQAVDFLFHHQPTYSDTEIAIRIREDHNLYTTARNIQQIRLQNGWLRRQNDPDERAIEQLQLTAFIEELLLQGHIRSYGRRQLITHLARKYGYRPRGRQVRAALTTLDTYGPPSRRLGAKRKRRENYEVEGPDWLWCLDGHDKLARFGIEIYGSVDACSRKIIWFYVGSSSRTQVSVLSQYLAAIETRGTCPNFIRTDKGRETPMMADAQYHLFYQATVAALGIATTEDDLDNACMEDCYIFGTSTKNIRVEGLWGIMFRQQSGQWVDFFWWLEAEGWFREDSVCDKVILLYVFVPLLREEIFTWVEDHNAAPIWP